MRHMDCPWHSHRNARKVPNTFPRYLIESGVLWATRVEICLCTVSSAQWGTPSEKTAVAGGPIADADYGFIHDVNARVGGPTLPAGQQASVQSMVRASTPPPDAQCVLSQPLLTGLRGFVGHD